jgi:hypothetical protein
MFDQPCSGTVQLADITGKVIDSRQFSNQKTPAVSFDLKGYPASLYVVLVQCEGTTLIRRIIVKD